MINSENVRGAKIFVTGADGFIGSHLVEKLATLGATVKCLCQYNSEGNIGNLNELPKDILSNIEIVFGDIRDRSLIGRQVQGFENIFHLASLISIPHSYVAPQSYVDTNISGTLNLLEEVKTRPIRRLVSTSTSEVYGTAITKPIDETHPLQGQSPYSASKIAVDHLIEAYHRSFDMPLVTLRPFNTFGPRQSTRAVIPTIISQLINQNVEKLHLGDLSPLRDFNYVENTVDAFIAIMFNQNVFFGEAYNAGSGSSISIGETLEIIQKSVGIFKEVKLDPQKSRPKNSEVFELIADYKKLNIATGWKPAITLEDGLKKTINWHLEKTNTESNDDKKVVFD